MEKQFYCMNIVYLLIGAILFAFIWAFSIIFAYIYSNNALSWIYGITISIIFTIIFDILILLLFT